MRKFLNLILIGVNLILIVGMVSGCSTYHSIFRENSIFGKNSNRVANKQEKIILTENKLGTIQDQKINQVSQLSYGVGDALGQSTEPSAEVRTAEKLNERVQTIAGLPGIEQQKAIKQMVSDLISNNIAGQKELAGKDKEIQNLSVTEQTLIKEKNNQIVSALKLEKSLATETDTDTLQLNKYQSFWGLGAVFLGLWSFIMHSLWFLGISFAVYFILRSLASVNPIAATIFGIFSNIGAIFIKIIEGIFPSSIATAISNVSSTVSTDINSIVSAAITHAPVTPAAPAAPIITPAAPIITPTPVVTKTVTTTVTPTTVTPPPIPVVASSPIITPTPVITPAVSTASPSAPVTPASPSSQSK